MQTPPFEQPPPPPRRTSSDARSKEKQVPVFIEPRRVPPYVGMTFENFRLISVLGRGHFGKVREKQLVLSELTIVWVTGSEFINFILFCR